MDRDGEIFNPCDKEQLRDFVIEVVDERISQYQKNQERTNAFV
jgi:hypothetical protein